MTRRFRKKVYDPREGYDLYAADYRKEHNHLDSFDWTPAKDLLARLLADRDPSTLAVLDAGCGDGRTFRRLLKIYPGITGIDVSERMLRSLREREPGARLVQADAVRLPFKAAGFDLCVAFFLLVHLDEPAAFLDEAYRVLKPSGLLVVNNIPQHAPPVLETSGERFVIRSSYHSDRSVLEAAERAGFVLEAEEKIVQKGAIVSTLLAWRK